MRLIDADAFPEEVEEITSDAYGIGFEHGRLFVLNEIHKAQTIDAVPVVHGHWDCVDLYDNVWRCSVCGEDWILNNGTPTENNMHYCIYCGAKMMNKSHKNENICFYCMNAFIDDNDKLHCMADGHDHEKTVEDDDSCDDFN